ncbi:MAG TPA: FecR domain-containing protein [Methylomirabilota bacterium]
MVTTLEGNVTVTRVTVPPQPLKFKDDVFVDDKVTTGDRSLARMLLGGKAVVTVRERSVLTITEVPGKATIDLSAGKIAVAVAKDKMRPGESIEIRAANAVAGIRGTVVVAEVSSASAQAGGVGGPTGTFWVLRGQVEAFLSNQAANAVLVGALQQFRGGAVTNIVPSQLAHILQGLSTAGMPLTKGSDEQAKETAATAGFELARSLTGAAVVAVGTNIPPLARVPNPVVVPITGCGSNCPPPPQPVTAPPSVTPPQKCDGYPWHSGYSTGGSNGVVTREEFRRPARTR